MSVAEIEITPDLVAEHGLKPDEYEHILAALCHAPNPTELGIFSLMWSEHCSYKSSRVWLKKLPTEGPQVICGPGENAGVVDIGDGQAAIFKMESHNHPSFIEPYQGAATGVGGIMRDVFTMGARPVANLNALRFGAPEHERTRYLVSGVVAGIGGYGNCIGVPTVGGEVNFDESYNGNILVNAMCVGIADTDKIFYAAASGVGNPVVYVGSKTGRDGIHGATMASAEFDDASEEKRPTVQVGDPFTEKLLLEACLELMAEDAIIGIQDMGAAGLTSSSVEMADKGGVGIELDLDKVPQRETGMTAYEMMLSESQERMLMVLKPGREARAEAIFEKWGLDVAVIGVTTDTGHLVVKHQGRIEADLPLKELGDGAPVYERPWVPTAPPAAVAPAELPAPDDLGRFTLEMLGSANLSSRRWVWEQYDHMVMGDTVQRPGGDAGVVRVHGTHKALAVACDVTPRYCKADPVMGGRQAIAEVWRNLTAVGAEPLAFTDCMNFGNPERPEIMGQFGGAIEGMRDAALALDFPCVSGNVSLYNETNGQAILPTPAIGGVGLIPDLGQMARGAFAAEGDTILLVGETKGALGQSLYQKAMTGACNGAPPPVDLGMERANGDFVRAQIWTGRTDAVHDLSDGGLLIALCEMAMAGRMGATVTLETDLPLFAFLFGEDQGRYLLTATPDAVPEIMADAVQHGTTVQSIGTVGGNELTVTGAMAISLQDMIEAHENWFPRFMAAEPGH